MSFAKLDAHCHSLSALEHALSILGVDEAVSMAPGGGEARAEAMATLSGMYHRQATDPKVRDWIEAAEADVVGPAVAADDPHRAADQPLGDAGEFPGARMA